MLRKYATVPLLLVAFAGLMSAQMPDAKASDWEEINFEYNSSKLVDGFPSLLRLAELLKANAGYKVTLEGHADAIGSAAANQKLGLDRANAVRDFLVKYGARAGQITTTSRGSTVPKMPGQKTVFTPTDEPRWMSRRVAMTVFDDKGNPVAAGGANDAIKGIPSGMTDCCSEVLKRLDKLDEIQRMLKDLADQNAALRRELGDLKSGQDALKAAQDQLKQGEQVLESKLNSMPTPAPGAPGPGGPAGPGGAAGGRAGAGTGTEADNKRSNAGPFQLLGVNVGSDDTGNTTFTGKGRFFAPLTHNTAFQAQGEYLYFQRQREAQFDFGLVERMKNVQAGLFASFKHVQLVGDQSGANLGQAALTVDYIFKSGKIGFFGTKGFMDNSVVNRTNLVVNGTTYANIFLETYLKIVDQAGISGTVALWKNNYFEGNIAYLHSALGNRAGGTAKLVFPLNTKIAFTVEGGVNETMQVAGNDGRAVVGVQFGNVIRPKEMRAADHPVPVDVPRVRYDVLTRRVRNGAVPPVADAGPNQIGVPAGTITLDGSASYDPNGDPLTYQWVQEAGPLATLSSPTSAKTTFTAQGGQNYSFRLTVKNTQNLSASARTLVQTVSSAPPTIVFFAANPGQIQPGQASTLTYQVVNADSVTISGIGPVQLNGSSQVSPTQTTTYTLTAKNSTATVTATATVVVASSGPKVQYCYATPMNIIAGESATLNYATTGATSVTITPGVGTVANSGTVAVSPTQTTTYTVTAIGPAGTTQDSCSVAVTVTAGALPRIIQFSAIPGRIDQGQTSTLLWLVENATSVNITNIGNVGISGSQDVTPQQTTTYTITATNAVGSVTAVATVNVNVVPPAKITSFTATPPVSPSPGSPVVLQCLADNATSITMNGILFLPGTATYKVYPTVDTTYTCIATGAKGNTDTQTVTVKVTQPGPPNTGQAPVIVFAGGNSLTTTYRQLRLDASGTYSPSGNTPLSFYWTVQNTNPAAILNPTSPTPDVQLGGPSGDYIFNLTVTDSKGNTSTGSLTVHFPIDHVQGNQ